jgi:hypothetical protein
MQMPGTVLHLKGVETTLLTPPEDRVAPDQVAGEVTAHQAYNRYGPREREPGDGH